MAKLTHAGFDKLNRLLGDLSAIEAGTQNGAKEQGLFQVMKGLLGSWPSEHGDLFELTHHLCIHTCDLH